ncbi:putative zinc-finger of transcription factor IIIC complex-domain-containing protein [Hyaloraphidium curvatum]|nr:putative zinc-finger of transcription factor IIIC complex-domain-containing protein [Hyaloraphidium curvatum]
MDLLLKFPTQAANLDTLSWSDAGSLLVITTRNLHVLTPRLGSTTNAFHRADIELPRTSARPRYEFVDEVEFRPDMSASESFVAACWSPMGCSPLGGTLVLAVTSRGRAVVYAPDEDPLGGTWSVMFDFSKDILQNVVGKKAIETRAEFEAAEVTSCAWSASCTAESTSSSYTFVTLGTRAGSVLVWRFCDQEFAFTGSFEVQPSSWITRQCWLPLWDDTGASNLVVAGSSGSLDVLETRVDETGSRGPQLVESARQRVWECDDRLPTAIRWTKSGREGRRFAAIKGNQLHVASKRSNGWELWRTMLDSFTPIVGVAWNTTGTALELITLDGAVYVIDASTAALDVADNKTSEFYGALLRHRVFEASADDDEGDGDQEGNAAIPGPLENPITVQRDARDASKSTVLRPYPTQARLLGLSPSKFGSIQAVHFSLQSVADVEFKIAIKAVSYVLFRTVSSEGKLGLLDWLQHELADPRILDRCSSTAFAIDVVNEMSAQRVAPEEEQVAPESTLVARTVALLSPPSVDHMTDGSSVFGNLATPSSVEPDASPTAKLSNHLDVLRSYWFHSVQLNKLRVLNTVLASMKVFDLGSSMALARNFDMIHLHHTDGLMRWLERVLRLSVAEGANDAISHSLMTLCDYVLLNPDAFPDLLPTVKDLCELLVGDGGLASPSIDVAPELAAVNAMLSKSAPTGLPLRERCPACQEFLPLDSPWKATCAKGHAWERCSVTMTVISTPYVRICTGCRKRTLLPRHFAGTVLEGVLRAYDQCLYCGERLAIAMKES